MENKNDKPEIKKPKSNIKIVLYISILPIFIVILILFRIVPYPTEKRDGDCSRLFFSMTLYDDNRKCIPVNTKIILKGVKNNDGKINTAVGQKGKLIIDDVILDKFNVLPIYQEIQGEKEVLLKEISLKEHKIEDCKVNIGNIDIKLTTGAKNLDEFPIVNKEYDLIEIYDVNENLLKKIPKHKTKNISFEEEEKIIKIKKYIEYDGKITQDGEIENHTIKKSDEKLIF